METISKNPAPLEAQQRSHLSLGRLAAIAVVAIACLAAPGSAIAQTATQLANANGWVAVNKPVAITDYSTVTRAGVIFSDRDDGWSGALEINDRVIGLGGVYRRSDVGRLRIEGRSSIKKVEADQSYLGGVAANTGGGPVDIGLFASVTGKRGNGTYFVTSFNLGELRDAKLTGAMAPLGFAKGYLPRELASVLPSSGTWLTGPNYSVETSGSFRPSYRTYWDPVRKWIIFAIEDMGVSDMDYNDTVIAIEVGEANNPIQPRTITKRFKISLMQDGAEKDFARSYTYESAVLLVRGNEENFDKTHASWDSALGGYKVEGLGRSTTLTLPFKTSASPASITWSLDSVVYENSVGERKATTEMGDFMLPASE